MGRRIMLAVLTLFAAASVVQAQGTGRITGRVTAIDGGRSLGGITVTVVGTRFGALTDTTGRYSINEIPVGAKQVKAQGLGFTSLTSNVTVTQGNAATLNFQLVSAPYQLQEVKTVGFGTQDTRTITGAVSTVTAEQMKDIPTSNAMKAIQGRVPGVEIVATSNEPGAAMQVRIRGVRSMSSGRNEPLYVVDGIPISGGIEDFNPANVESIDILKDAAATAIYGSRGSNGVVLVTTKRGVQDGKMHSSFNSDSYYGQQTPVKLIQMMNMTQFVKYLQDAAAGQSPALDTSLAKVLAGNTTVAGTTTPKRLYAYQNGIQTDWQRAVLRDGSQRSLQGGLTGSSPDTRYTLSGNYFGNVGLIPGQGYTRGAASASIDHTSKRLRLGLSANLSRIQQDVGEGQGAFGFALAMTPFGTPFNYTNKDSLGLLDPRPDDDPLNINPLLENQSMIRQVLTNRVFGSMYAELQLMDGLTFRTNFGPDYSNQDNGCFNTSWTHNLCANAGTTAPANQGGLPAAADRTQAEFAYTLDNFLQLNKDIGSKQHIDATLLYGIQRDRTNTNAETSTALPYTTQLWYDLGSGTPGIPTSSLAEWTLQSYMGRVNYTLLEKYTFNATVRSDGSSRLAPGHKWATFPSFGLGWQLGDEPFMKRFSFLNMLKLRGSYGTTGNTSISPYQTQGTLSARLYSFGSTIVRGYRPNNIANPDLSWEKTDQSDFGAEFAILNSRISGSVDGYRQNTHDLLLNRALPVTSGFTSTLQNVGTTRNIGYELGLSTVNLDGWHGVRWQSDFNWSTNKSTITSLNSGAAPCIVSALGCDTGNSWFVGYPISLADGQRQVFFNYKYAGIWQLADSVQMKSFNAAGGTTYKAGDIKLVDTNGDGKITVDDRQIVGDSYPGWTGSISNRVQYKGFDLSGLITAKWNYLFNDGTPRAYEGRYGVVADMDYWTPTNPTNANPKPTVNGTAIANAATRLLIDGSHWRIRNVTLGYTTSSSLASRIGASSLRLYGTAQDPYIHTSYLGNDPEVAGAAPTVRTFLFGTNIVW